MAQECCVCGERLSGFMHRGIHKQLRRTVELTERCRAVAEQLALDSSSQGLANMLHDYARQGDGFIEFWHDSAHSVGIPDPSEARDIKSEWNAWGKQARGGLGFASLSPEQKRRVAARG